MILWYFPTFMEPNALMISFLYFTFQISFQHLIIDGVYKKSVWASSTNQ